MDRRSYLAGTATLLAGSLSGCAVETPGASTVTDTVTKSYDVTEETSIPVFNHNGSVTVRPADGERLTVDAERRAGSERGLESISIDVAAGDRFVAEVGYEGGSDFSKRRANLTVSLPETVEIGHARTANGDVTVENVQGDASARTTNGTVELRNVEGFVDGQSGNGDVIARSTTGLDGAWTSNGRIDVELLAMRDDVRCESSNGPVTVGVGPDVAAGVRLHSETGRARVGDLPFEASTERETEIEGSLRGGTELELELRTTNGDVTLEPL